MKEDPDGHFWLYVVGAGLGAASGVAKYYVINKMQGKKSTWKVAGKAALNGAVNGLMSRRSFRFYFYRKGSNEGKAISKFGKN